VKVCIICNQFAAFGKIGGFGTAARALARGLKRRGVDVCAVVVRRTGQAAVETLDGVTVHGRSEWETLGSGRIYREIGADLYHSQEPTLATWHAERAVPEAAHVVTSRNPRPYREHFQGFYHSSWARRLRFPATWLYEISPFVGAAVRRADRVFVAARFLAPVTRRLYGVAGSFLPTPMHVPAVLPQKAARPTVLFVARFDPLKRVERFIALARALPEYRFIAVGKAHERAYDRKVRALMSGVPNLEAPGFVSVFDTPGLAPYYGAAWVLVNVSLREGLPDTFLEAAAHGCAVLSTLDPEGFPSRFGLHVADRDLEDGLRRLVAGDLWRAKGEAARREVAETFEEGRATDAHLAAYEEILASRRRRA
jgi:glycosyltransferase involved in cell wall biosynthesis